MKSNQYLRKNVSIAWPLALNALLMQSMLMIDTFLVSPLGEISLAAMGIAATIVGFVLGIQMALANGSQLVLSRAVGSGSDISLARGFFAAMSINMITAILFLVLITFFDEAIVGVLTQNKQLQNEVITYLDIAKYLLLFNASTQVMIALCNAHGMTKVPFKGYLIELPVNIIASFMFIHGAFGFIGLGVEGAALGSVIAIVVRFVFLSAYLESSRRIKIVRVEFDAKFRHNIALHFKEIFPVAANVTMLQVGATIYQLIYSQLNINAFVAITIIMPWIKAGTQFIVAWSLSSAIMVSQAIGANKLDDLENNINSSVKMAMGISLISMLFFILLSLTIERFYPDLSSDTYTALSVIAPLYILLPVVRAYNTVHGHVLRAVGRTTDVFKVNFGGQWLIGIPLCAYLVIGLDVSIFWAFAIIPLEEVIKLYPFRYIAKKAIKEFDQQNAAALSYD